MLIHKIAFIERVARAIYPEAFKTRRHTERKRKAKESATRAISFIAAALPKPDELIKYLDYYTEFKEFARE